MLTFFRKEPFDLTACYANSANLPLKDGFIGKFVSCVIAGIFHLDSVFVFFF